MRKVWIMRGIPGCGKDTFIKNFLMERYSPVVLCADDFHMRDGKYNWRPENAKAAHDQVLKQFVTLTQGHAANCIVVNNTNIRMFEIAPYYRLAEAFHYEVEIIQFLCHPALGTKRNVHNVPSATIEQMARNIEPLPTWWNVNYIVSKDEPNVVDHEKIAAVCP